MASVSKVIHTDNQLHAGQFGKTAYTEWKHSVALFVIRLLTPSCHCLRFYDLLCGHTFLNVVSIFQSSGVVLSRG
jgi:hypothetical protein